MTIDWSEKKIYGALGKLGVAMPAGGYIAITDFHRWLHPDIAISDIPLPMKQLNPAGLQKMSEDVIEAMKLFKEFDPVDLSFFSCTAASMIGGKGYDQYLCDVLKEASGAKAAYTTTTAVLRGLRALGAKRITICTPYPDDVNAKEEEYFAGEGFEINRISGMVTADLRDPGLIGKITPEEIYRFAVERTHPDSDTLFISCTGLTVFEIIHELEARLGIPVVSSNQCAAWCIGRHFGKHSLRAREKLGRLFSVE